MNYSKSHYQTKEIDFIKNNISNVFFGKKVLDVGCGEGKYLKILQNIALRVVGIDLNKDQVANLNSLGFDAFHPEDLPIHEKYDVILISHVIEHMNHIQLISFFDKYFELLNDDGRLVIITPMPGERFWHDYTHVRPYTPQSLGMMFGILGAPSEFSVKYKLQLENIFFFKDCIRFRNHKNYYFRLNFFGKIIKIYNDIMHIAYVSSGGRIGVKASWLGIYKKNS